MRNLLNHYKINIDKTSFDLENKIVHLHTPDSAYSINQRINLPFNVIKDLYTKIIKLEEHL